MNPYDDLTDDELLDQCRIESRRASGPGGQHRNKVQTAVRLHHQPTGLTAGASERRSRRANLRLALSRLRAKLDEHFHVDPPRVPTRKSRATRRRELEAKRRRGEQKRLRRTPAEE